jgi:hypothetical protein
LLTGCQTTVQRVVKRSLTPEEIQAIQAGQKSVVLVRLTATETRDQESLSHIMDVRWNIWNVNDWQNRQLLVKPEDSAPSLSWRVPSEELGRAGWRYLVLDPGRYFMKVVPDEGMAETLPVYHVSIPQGPKLVYVGSFYFVPTNEISCFSQGKKKTYSGFEFEGMSDESNAAQKAGRVGLPSFGSVTTSLAVMNDLAAALQPYSGRRILSVETTNRPMHATKYVGHKAAAITAAPFAITGMLILSLAGDDDDEQYYGEKDKDDDVAGRAAIACCGLVLVAAAVPIAIIGDATFGSIARMNWSSHEAALRQEIVDFNLAGRLTNSLLSALSSTNATLLNETNGSASQVVHVDVYRIGLEPMGYFSFDYTFEIQVYLSVTEAASNTVIWEHGYVYCNKDLKRKSVPFATFVQNAERESSLKAYKGRPGRERVRDELEDAGCRLSEEMVAHFKAAGF